MILVTGSTGKTGRRVAQMLSERGMSVRAASRSTPTRFDWVESETWEQALQSVSAVYLVAPELGSPQAAEAIAAFTRQAAAAGVRRAVLLSVPHGEGLDPEHVVAAERAAGEAGLEWTVLRPRWFFQNFSEDFLYEPVMSGELRLPAGDGAEAFIDAQDIAAVAVAALTEDGHHERCYELTGPRKMTFKESAAEISKATGRDISYTPLTKDEYLAEQRDLGVPEEWAQLLAALYDGVGAGKPASLTDDVQTVLGRPPRDFADYAQSAEAQEAWRN